MLHTWLQHLTRSVGLVLLLGVAGCAGLNDPFQRSGTWRPEYNNDANLAAMVADPRHLVRGVGDPESPGEISAAAVRRLLADKVKPLAHGSSGQTQQSSSADSGSGGSQ
jgi:hypothetical protein